MVTAASVVVCALSMLGRGAGTLPRIAFVDAPPPGISRQAEGFALRDPDTIYLVTSSDAFRTAVRTAERSHLKCGHYVAVAKVASVIVHEEWHLRHDADERGAYEAQIMVLRARLGFEADSAIVFGVRKAMRAALREPDARPSRPDTVVASSQP